MCHFLRRKQQQDVQTRVSLHVKDVRELAQVIAKSIVLDVELHALRGARQVVVGEVVVNIIER